MKRFPFGAIVAGALIGAALFFAPFFLLRAVLLALFITALFRFVGRRRWRGMQHVIHLRTHRVRDIRID